MSDGDERLWWRLKSIIEEACQKRRASRTTCHAGVWARHDHSKRSDQCGQHQVHACFWWRHDDHDRLHYFIAPGGWEEAPWREPLLAHPSLPWALTPTLPPLTHLIINPLPPPPTKEHSRDRESRGRARVLPCSLFPPAALYLSTYYIQW